MFRETRYSVCEIPVPNKKKRATRNRLYRFDTRSFRWKGIKPAPYKLSGEDFSGIIRQAITGTNGESTKFHLRYFEISPGGYSSYETHRHEHVVICIRGRGRVKLGTRSVEMKPFDILYIAPEKPHRLYNPYQEPFGFFCIVDAKRDRPKPVKNTKRRRI
ncbi:MAG: cupin domain-containing protein [Nitrospirae bacterium]|nr:MAG: cupin domain-containing protein [Nitrospirota bacterium]